MPPQIHEAELSPYWRANQHPAFAQWCDELRALLGIYPTKPLSTLEPTLHSTGVCHD